MERQEIKCPYFKGQTTADIICGRKEITISIHYSTYRLKKGRLIKCSSDYKTCPIYNKINRKKNLGVLKCL